MGGKNLPKKAENGQKLLQVLFLLLHREKKEMGERGIIVEDARENIETVKNILR